MNRQRTKENVDGLFYGVEIEHDCGCELPEGEAPDLVRMSDRGGYQSYFYKQPYNSEEIDRAINAINICPIHDLRYSGTDPEIIARINPSQSDYCILKNGKIVINEQNT